MKYPVFYIFISILLCGIPVSFRGHRPSPAAYVDLAPYRKQLALKQRGSAYYKPYRAFDQGGTSQAVLNHYENLTSQEIATLVAQFNKSFLGELDQDLRFSIGSQLEKPLPHVSKEQYPDKRKEDFNLCEEYYYFFENLKGIELLERAWARFPSLFPTERTSMR